MKYILLSITTILSAFQCCTLPSQFCPREFQLQAELTPEKSEFLIGDTITINSIIDRHVFDLNTEKEYDMEGIDWSMGLGVIRLDRDSSNRFKTQKYFDFISNQKNNLRWFTFSDGSTEIHCDYDYEDNTFSLEAKIIAKSPGVFYLIFASGLVGSTQDFPGKCSGTGFDAVTVMNDGEDNNIHLLEESPNPHFNDWILLKPQRRFHDSGGYCFRVVE